MDRARRPRRRKIRGIEAASASSISRATPPLEYRAVFEGARALNNVSEEFKQYQISCFSIRLNDTRFKIICQAEKLVGESMESVAMSSATLVIGMNPFELGAIPISNCSTGDDQSIEILELVLYFDYVEASAEASVE